MNDVVEKNIERIVGNSEGNMWYCVLSRDPESMCGTAGTWEGLSCIGVNFFYDGKSGEIKYFFGNPDLAPDDIRSRFREGTFRFAIDFRTRKYRIVSLQYRTRPAIVARQNLEETVRVYNESRGLDPKKIKRRSKIKRAEFSLHSA